MFFPVRQNFPHRALPDVTAAAHAELASSGLASRLPFGAKVAVGVGSRGISNIAAIVRAVVDHFHSAGLKPFIFPAMGSHGAATAAGQTSVLAHYGIDEASMGCPIASSFDVISLGRTPDLDIEVFAGRDAWASECVFLINRVKWHTSFDGALESGVCKMLAIGLGKIEGARSAHGHARNVGMDAVIHSIAGHLIATGKILGGLAILEDAYHATAKLAALPAAHLIAEEEDLLRLTKSWMGRIPVPLDVLIIDEIGKNISGTGMDMKVVNRGPHGQVNPWTCAPKIERIFLRDLSALSYGNAVGVGLSDVIHDRLLAKIDFNAGRINAMTSGSLAAVKTPLHFPTDRECLELVMATVGKFDPNDVSIGWIRSTLDLGDFALTENLLDEVRKNQFLEITGPGFEMAFDEAGNLRRP